MRVAQWIELSNGALGNERVLELAGCLKHQLQHWAHFVLFSSFFQHSGEFLYVCLSGLSSMLGPLVTRWSQSLMDARSTNSNIGLILHLFFFLPTFG
jgi:hypothetical protein